MTTATSATRVRHDSDATFREWALEWSTKVQAAGLVVTADTGQINFATVTRPGTNTDGGYEIYRFNDTQQSTSPIFIRFDYGTGVGATTPRIRITVGTGSNGSGTITGTAPFTVNLMFNGGAETTDTGRNSYWCTVDGAFSWFWKSGAASTCCGVIGRTVDSAMTPDADGAMVVLLATTFMSTACMNFVGTDTITAKFTGGATASLCHWPQGVSSSTVGSDQQAATAYGVFPRFRPVPYILGVLNSEFTTGNTFSDTPVGTTPHTYLACGNFTNMDATLSLKPAIIFE